MKRYLQWPLLTLALLILAAVILFPAAEASKGGRFSRNLNTQGQRKADKGKAAQKTERNAALPANVDAADEDAEDADLPRLMRGKINEEEYLLARNEYLLTRLGMEPGKPYSPAIREQAVRQMRAQEARLRAASKQGALAPDLSGTAWTNLGPYPIPNGQTSGVVQAVSGRTISIAIHPTNPDLVYVGTAQGGLYRSSNGGTTWTQLFNNADSQVIGAIAISPSNPEIVYVGTGENGQCGSGCYAGVGVYRIDNASTTADLTGPINPLRNYNDGSNVPTSANIFTGRSISKILVNPTDPSIIFVATASAIVGNPQQTPQGNFLPPLGVRGLYRLGNATGSAAGVTATKLTVSATNCFDTPCTGNLSVLDMVYDGNDATGNTLVCWLRPTTGTEGGVYRATDALTAATFVNKLSQTATANSRGELASVTIAGTTTMYLANGESSTGRIRKSTDGGQTWGAALAGASGFCGGQCFYDIAIGIDPTNANIAYVGGAAGTNILRRTTDGFATAANTPSRQTGLHADDHVVAVANAPNNNVVYNGNDGGIWRSTDGGTTWTSLNNSTFVATQFQSISVHPTDRWFSIGGTQDNGTNFLQANAPALPSAGWTHADFGDGGYARIDQTAADTSNVVMYHTYFNQTNNLIGFARVSNVSCATDGNWAFKGVGAGVFTNACGDVEGTNGIAATDAVLFYAPLELGPVAGSVGQTVYFGTDRLYRSINKGDTMTVVSNAGASAALVAGVPITTLGISPQDDAARIVGLSNGNVFATTTGSAVGAAMINVTPPGMVNTRTVGKVLIDPNNHFTAYVTYGGQFGLSGIPLVNHIWKTTNLNAATPTWTATASGIPDVPVNALIVDPANSNDVYAGTDVGVYKSSDAGATWNPFGTGLPKMAIFDMAIQNPNRILRIATHGRGFWEIALPAGAGCTITCPANITQANDANQCGAVVTYPAPSTTGTCGTISCSPASGSFFPVGTTTVTCTTAGAGPSCTFTVTVQDTQAPTISACPANITQSNDPNQCGAVVTYTAPTTSDNCPGATVNCSPASGSFFPVGTTTVTCTASDASPNSPNTSCTFTVTVNDTQAPTITCPANITVPAAPGFDGANVDYPAPVVTDNCPPPAPVCNPASGSFFPIGVTTVTCTAGGTSCVSKTITHSSSQAITSGNSVSCNDGVGHTDNHYWRAFNLPSFSISGTYHVQSVDIGIEQASSGGGGMRASGPSSISRNARQSGQGSRNKGTRATEGVGGPGQPITVLLHTNTGGAFPGGTLNFLNSVSLTVPDQSGTILNVPITADVPAGSELVLEVFTPDGTADGNLFFIGSNAAPETGPSYISAPDCGINSPTTTTALGFPNMHIVENVHGCEDVTGGPSSSCTFTVTVKPPRYWSTIGSGGTADEDSATLVSYDDFGVKLKDGLTGTATVRYNITATHDVSAWCPATQSVVYVRFRNSDNAGTHAQVRFDIHRTSILNGGNDTIFSFNSNGLGAGNTFTSASLAPNIDFDFSNYVYWIEATIFRDQAGQFADLGSIEVFESAGDNPCP